MVAVSRFQVKNCIARFVEQTGIAFTADVSKLRPFGKLRDLTPDAYFLKNFFTAGCFGCNFFNFL